MPGHYFESRDNWLEQARLLGFDTALLSAPPYWVEALEEPFCLELTVADIALLEQTGRIVQSQVLALVERVCCGPDSEVLMERLSIPPDYRRAVRLSFERHDPSLYSRFDLAFGPGQSSPRLLELNADTPSSLMEASVLQLAWLAGMKERQALLPESDQYNFLQDGLVDFFSKHGGLAGTSWHFAYYPGAREDRETVKYLCAVARSLGIDSTLVELNQLRSIDGTLVDGEGRLVERLFKLYPWELLFEDDSRIKAKTGHYLFLPLLENGRLQVFEPLWKSVLAGKAALSLLYEMFPDSPYLLPTYMESSLPGDFAPPYVIKPVFGREGAGVRIVLASGAAHETCGNAAYAAGGNADQEIAVEVAAEEYNGPGRELNIVQRYSALPVFAGCSLVFGLWLMAGKPCGLSLRADRSKITGRSALFVPHYVI
ncbi:MAG: glutathionylspermidine synthase family protein [Candidatus Obscuribacter sp.]|nr:glutathionylspermidine synthase family protein [Candidatus Melainabacteria bacterium]MDX1988770.1 glutathionylspermidine synthase family protein [Candidatus Obscuribacter sp.]